MADLRAWTVHRPGPLTPRAAHLWTVDDEVPGLAGVSRRMSIVRRTDGTLVFFNAIPLPDAALAELRALGTPGALVLPNHFHALDAGAFAEKLQVPVYVPDVAVARLANRLRGTPIGALPPGDDLRVFTVGGFSTHETVLVAHDSLLVGDLVTNVPHAGGLRGFLLRLVGFTGPAPRLPPPVRRRVGRDLPAVRRLLERLADLPGVQRLVPSHGALVEGDVAGALRAVASTLPAA